MSDVQPEAYIKFEVITQEDDNGDLLIPIPPLLLEQIKWREGDPVNIRWENGRWIITRGET